MTEQERIEWRALKSRCTEELRRVWHSKRTSGQQKALDSDPRLAVYVGEVVNHPEAHNLYEQLSVARFLRQTDTYGWDTKRVRHFIRLYESLRFSGITGRCRYRLTPVQVFQFANIFGLCRSDGRRLIRTAYIFVPRKFSKTTSAAALAVYDMLFGDYNAEAYVAANSYDQAKRCFDEIRGIMFDLDPCERHFRINREKITFRHQKRDSLAQCLTANARTKDGLYASLVIIDEYAQARNSAGRNGADLKNVLTTSMGPRSEPLTLVISTASEVVDGPFYHELEGVKAVLRGELANEGVFASLFMPDADDDEGDPATWHKVQPHMGVTVKPEYYAEAWNAAQLSAENMQAFRTKLLNIFTIVGGQSWIPYEKTRHICSGGFAENLPAGGKPFCACAFDLSVRDDFSAVAYTYHHPGQHKFYSHVDYYFPRGALEGHPNEQLYRQWAAQGHLTLCDGDCIDVRRIAGDIVANTRELNIVRIGYDAYKSQELTNILKNAGARYVLQPYSQTYGSFNLPVESFEMLVWSDPPGIALDANPINVFCLSNCVIDEDNLGNKKPLKASATRKIDGIICVLMTLGQLYTYEH